MATNPTTFLFTLVHIWMVLFNTCNAQGFIPVFNSILIFGDSSVDTGNNNYIHTIAKANFSPYGKDYPGQTPTGRFSNGKLVPDFVASTLGIKEAVPPFLDPELSDDDIRTGVNFASAMSGYDDLTSAETNTISMSRQIELFKKYIARLNGIVGEEESKKIINSSLVIFSAGSNDFAINYYDIPLRRLKFNISGYQDFLLNKLQGYIKGAYDLGSRIMVIGGLPPIGCLPIQMTIKFKSARTCLEDQNSDARSYNEKLAKLLPQIQAQLPGSKILYGDLYKPLSDLIYNPQKYGFVEANIGCCGSGALEVSHLCNSWTQLCGNASQYIFWDSMHPTQAAYQYLSTAMVEDVVSQFVNISQPPIQQ